MKTAVYQSYRTRDVPAWVNRCMQSVRAWADAQPFDYRFIDDRLGRYRRARRWVFDQCTHGLPFVRHKRGIVNKGRHLRIGSGERFQVFIEGVDLRRSGLWRRDIHRRPEDTTCRGIPRRCLQLGCSRRWAGVGQSVEHVREWSRWSTFGSAAGFYSPLECRSGAAFTLTRSRYDDGGQVRVMPSRKFDPLSRRRVEFRKSSTDAQEAER